METLTNETVKKLIDESGRMWEAVRDRVGSPVLLQAPDQPTNHVYELSLPPREKHPFWRVSERELTPDEDAARMAFLRGGAYRLGDLMAMDNGSYLRVRAYVFNGRRDRGWDISVERVSIKVVSCEPVNLGSRQENQNSSAGAN